MNWFRRTAATAGLTAALLAGTGAVAATPLAADTQTTNTYFICPTVSTNNPNGMWVIGYHGAYYVIVPTNGDGSKDYITVPVTVFDVAQIPAGWGLYSRLPNYPNFVGGAGILYEGIDHWLSGAPGFNASQWNEGDMVMVSSYAGGTETVTDMTSRAMVAITTPIPLWSGAIW